MCVGITEGHIKLRKPGGFLSTGSARKSARADSMRMVVNRTITFFFNCRAGPHHWPSPRRSRLQEERRELSKLVSVYCICIYYESLFRGPTSAAWGSYPVVKGTCFKGRKGKCRHRGEYASTALDCAMNPSLVSASTCQLTRPAFRASN